VARAVGILAGFAAAEIRRQLEAAEPSRAAAGWNGSGGLER
jgi:hypothetical protein